MIQISNKLNIILKILIIISFPFLTLKLSNRFNSLEVIINCLLSLIVSIFIVRKIKIENLNKLTLLISLYFSLETLSILINKGDACIRVFDRLSKFIPFTLQDITIKQLDSLFSLPSLLFVIYLIIKYIIPKIISFFKNLSKTELRYLLIVFIIGSLSTIIITKYTTVFSVPYYNNEVVRFDALYMADSGEIGYNDAFTYLAHPENDIRQPLFGLFALPFGVLAKIISRLLFFVRPGYERLITLTVIQFILYAISNILLSRLLNIKENNKKYFLLFMSLNMTFILFSLIIEQYIIALFYLILAIYYHYKNPDKINYLYNGAVSTLLTSGIIFPLIKKFKNIKDYIKSVFKCFLAFVSLLILSGQLPTMIHYNTSVSNLKMFLGTMPLIERLYQYTHFIKGLFISNPGKVILDTHPMYNMNTYTSLSFIGIAIFIIWLISIFVNRKEKIIKLTLIWGLFSILINVIIGWGLQENILVLYSSYYLWAFYIPIYLLIKKIIKNDKISNISLTLLVLTLFIINIPELIRILEYAVQYYQ